MMNQLICRAFHRYHSHVRFMSIDVHTHMYTPKYMDILQKRIDIPRVIMINNQARLVILPGEDKEITTSIGRIISIYVYIYNAYFFDIHINIIVINYLSITFITINVTLYLSFLSTYPSMYLIIDLLI
jgi:hypothetical protein